jgi:hypothetical protein
MIPATSYSFLFAVDADADAEDATAGPAKGSVGSKQKSSRRWLALEGAQGKTYYHNTETGEDRYVKGCS